ncbi:MAG: ANTAR domain-containing protein [Blautia sp.]|nr:ANTAR domain-containing protein [Blautia sp.]MCM1199676.1 ANTAR domain-containing protein [Bacteroides fragilis]
MINIIIALPKIDDARSIRSILLKNGFQVTGVCTAGAQVLSQIDGWNDGIVICGYKLNDMMYSELHACLPDGFDMLLMASQRAMNECLDNDIVCLSMPFKVHDLVDTVSMISHTMIRRRRKAKRKPGERNAGETALIKEAKELLMFRNNMTEEEAHRYLQKCSMDSGTNMVETAQMVLAMFH